ncbi:RNase P subunit p30 [Trinorchestia longiramus]|nr:RNase P subunit p30 [Trinorchestia longiramus]
MYAHFTVFFHCAQCQCLSVITVHSGSASASLLCTVALHQRHYCAQLHWLSVTTVHSGTASASLLCTVALAQRHYCAQWHCISVTTVHSGTGSASLLCTVALPQRQYCAQCQCLSVTTVHRGTASASLLCTVALAQRLYCAQGNKVCQTLMYVDIISLEPDSQVCSVKLPRKICRLAVERDLYFELKYAPCVGSENINAWQNTIKISHLLSDYINSHNVFLTSGAASPDPIRSPADVIAMARFFGLSLGVAHSAVSALCHDVVHCAMQRRAGANKCNVVIHFTGATDNRETPSKNTAKRKATKLQAKTNAIEKETVEDDS